MTIRNFFLHLLAALALLTVLALAACSEPEAEQTDHVPQATLKLDKNNVRAREGDAVMLIVSSIKNDSKAAYEQFMEDKFFNLIRRSNLDGMDDQYRQTRWLGPARQNEDGSWTYAFIMDPLVDNGNYNFMPLFTEFYSERESMAMMKEYESFFTAPPQFHMLVQTAH